MTGGSGIKRWSLPEDGPAIGEGNEDEVEGEKRVGLVVEVEEGVLLG